jgi:hypothetical protein
MKFLRQTAVSVWNVLPDFRHLASSPSSGIHLDEYQMAETLSVSCVSLQFFSHSAASDTVCIFSDSYTLVPDDEDIVSFRNVGNHFRFSTHLTAKVEFIAFIFIVEFQTSYI